MGYEWTAQWIAENVKQITGTKRLLTVPRPTTGLTISASCDATPGLSLAWWKWISGLFHGFWLQTSGLEAVVTYTNSYCFNTGYDSFTSKILCFQFKERKGKEEYLYSAILVRTHTLKVLRHRSHSFTCKLHHACLSFISVHQMALPLIEVADIELQLTTHLSTPKGWKAELAWLVEL